jgi:antitoxin ParD1/3/4
MSEDATFHLETYFQAFIEEMVASGRFSSPSQVVQAGLRLLEQRESQADALAAALQEGEDSGLAEDFDFDKFLARKNAEFVERERGRASRAWLSIRPVGVAHAHLPAWAAASGWSSQSTLAILRTMTNSSRLVPMVP